MALVLFPRLTKKIRTTAMLELLSTAYFLKYETVGDSSAIMLPIRLAQAVTVLIFIREVSGLNLGREMDYHD
jgi:hypothetical protein